MSMFAIDKEELFKEALQNGFNLFTGAGFSTLPSPEGKCLPHAADLAKEICEKFSIDERFSNDLEKLSGILNTRSKQQFQEYLRTKYTVSSYNQLYNVLDKLNIRSYITTNIDNIPHCVFGNNKRHYMQSIVMQGAAKRYSEVVTYIPLHGEVNNPDSNLYFGKNELANVDDSNKELFHSMEAELYKAPTLFCGYGFHDGCVSRAISKILTNKPQRIWVQCLPDDTENIDYFRALGCYVIVSDTKELLEWLERNAPLANDVDSVTNLPAPLIKYTIPDTNKISTVSKKEYFLNAATDWYCILSGYPAATSFVDNIYENILQNKNLVIVGIPFSGKTTLLMQLAASFNSREAKLKLFLSNATPQQARQIVNNIGNKPAIVFIDDFSNDIEAAGIFMERQNIRVVCADSDYVFETSKHLVENIDYKKIDFGELSVVDSQKIFEKIPQNLRKEYFSYKETDSDKFSMFEMMAKNVDKILSADKIKFILTKIKNMSYEAFEIVAIAAYLTKNKSILSTSVLFSYFETSDYEWLKTQINVVKNYLSEINVPLTEDEYDQDYYVLRSRLFVKQAFYVLTDCLKREFAKIVRKFITRVPPYNIYEHYIFKRYAYDAKLFYKLFNDKALDLYEIIYSYERNAFTLQQRAMYKFHLKDYTGAYADIEEAINKSPHNFSIKNTLATILFNANKNINTDAALDKLKEAMSILEKCYKSDKRKIFHATDYANFAIFLAREHNIPDYLNIAELWLKDILEQDEVTRQREKSLRGLLTDIDSIKN